jgi:hypothetical protein
VTSAPAPFAVYEVISPAPTDYPSDAWGLPVALAVLCLWTSGVFIGFERAIACLTLLGFGLVVIGLLRPTAGLIGAGLLCTIDPLTRHYVMTGGLLRYNTLNYVLAALLLFAFAYTIRLTDPHSRLLHLLIILMVLGLAVTPDHIAGVEVVLNVAAVHALVVCFLRALEDRRVWFWVAIVNGIAGAAGAAVFFLQFENIQHMNENAFSHYLTAALFSICVCLVMFKTAALPRFILMLLAVSNSMFIFLTGSRQSTLVAALCLVLVMAALKGVGQRALVLISCAAIANVAFVVFPDFAAFSVHRVSKLMDSEYSAAERTSGRSEIYQAGWYMFTENPLGVGTGGFARVYAGLNVEGLRLAAKERGAHSAWLKTMAENGVLGIGILTAYVFSFLIAGLHRHSEGKLSLGLMVTAALTLAFTASEFQGKAAPWLAASATVILHYLPDGFFEL